MHTWKVIAKIITYVAIWLILVIMARLAIFKTHNNYYKYSYYMVTKNYIATYIYDDIFIASDS